MLGTLLGRSHHRAVVRALSTLSARHMSAPAPQHLVVLLHGLHSHPSDLSHLHHRFTSLANAPHVLLSSSGGDQTEGIDSAGLQVAREIEHACDSLGSHGSVSIVAHSNGGLVARWALGDLLTRTLLLQRWKPRLLVARIATPRRLPLWPVDREHDPHRCMQPLLWARGPTAPSPRYRHALPSALHLDGRRGGV